MLVRDGEPAEGSGPLEVLMVRRNLSSDFVGGVYIFPGGALDPADGDPSVARLCVGRTTPRPAPCWPSRRAAWPTGWPPSGSASRRPGSSWPTAPTAGHSPSPTRSSSAATSATATSSTPAGAPSSSCARTRGCAWLLTGCTTSPTGSPPRGPPGATTPGSSWPRPRPDQTPVHDDRRAHRDPVAAAGRRPGAPPGGRASSSSCPPSATLATLARFERCADLLAAVVRAEHQPAIVPHVVLPDRASRIGLPGDPGYPEPADR